MCAVRRLNVKMPLCQAAKMPQYHTARCLYVKYQGTWRRLGDRIPLRKAARLPRYLTTTLPDVYM